MEDVKLLDDLNMGKVLCIVGRFNEGVEVGLIEAADAMMVKTILAGVARRKSNSS